MWSVVLGLAGCAVITAAQTDNSLNEEDFVKRFSKCKRSSPDFDECIRNAINSVTIYFKRGVPELFIPPFDPFFMSEVVQERGSPGASYRLVLSNVKEMGWTQSFVTKFKSDPEKQLVRFTQYFPEKYLEGEYNSRGTFMGSNMSNKGFWNMTLYDLVQTTTVSRPNKNGKQLKVYVDVQTIGDMDLHVSNLLRGLPLMEGILDRMINSSWRPVFPMVRPLINDLVSTAFTSIFTRSLGHLDLNRILS